MTSARILLQELQSHPAPARTLELLKQLSNRSLTARQLFDYHERLLFLKAYPPSKSIRRFCEDELNLFHLRIEMLDDEARAKLELSGIVGTKMTYAYEYPLAQWLVGKAGRKIDIDWDIFEEQGSGALETLLPVLLENSEHDAVDSLALSVRDCLTAAAGKRTTLQWLLKRLADRLSPESLWSIYELLDLDLTYDLYPPAPSRSLVDDGQPDSLYLWNPVKIRKPLHFMHEMKRPLTIGNPVSVRRARKLLDMVHGSLLVRLREYYGASRANPEEFYETDVGRGLHLIFWFMRPEFRLPIECGFGGLLLKNAVPIGYCGGGLHPERLEVAVNVFDTFRGVEAAWIYTQTARFFHSFSGVPWIVARQYQLGGENNLEGLKSGSFWFYYKLGFRSTDPEIRELAEAERRMIRKKKGYRTPLSTLRRLSREDAVLSLEGRDASEYREPPLDGIGLLASKVIRERFGGRRTALTERVLRDLHKTLGANYAGWTKAEKTRFALFGLFLLAIPGIENWSRRDLDKLIRLGRAKGSQLEGNYVRAMRRNLRFYNALAEQADLQHS